MTEVCITIHKSLEEKESDFSKEQNMSPSMSFLFVLAMGFILPLSGVVSVISHRSRISSDGRGDGEDFRDDESLVI
jgi:uncharacterized membrane protein